MLRLSGYGEVETMEGTQVDAVRPKTGEMGVV